MFWVSPKEAASNGWFGLAMQDRNFGADLRDQSVANGLHKQGHLIANRIACSGLHMAGLLLAVEIIWIAAEGAKPVEDLASGPARQSLLPWRRRLGVDRGHRDHLGMAARVALTPPPCWTLHK